VDFKIPVSIANDLAMQSEAGAKENLDKTILLVDDDIELLCSIAEQLRSLGYSVVDHFDALDALECFRQNAEINCVLTDIDMPGDDGHNESYVA